MALNNTTEISFNPELITSDLISKAAEILKSGQESVKPSTIYDVIIDGNRYPPKEVMRIAHRLATGNDVWLLPGGKPTNELLEKLGFDVMTKASDYSVRKNYWKFSPDAQARRWEEFHHDGIMAVSFKSTAVGDLRKYKSLRAIEKAIGKENSNDAYSLWTCCHAPIGDVVLANKGRNTVVGIGVIDGEYEYHPEKDFPHVRKVKWLADKEWNYIPGQFGSNNRKRNNLFRIDALSKTEVGPEILKVYLEKYPEYEEIFTENNIWPVYDEATYDRLVSKVAGFNNPDLVDRYFEFIRIILERTGISENNEYLFLSTPRDSNSISFTYNQRYITYLRQTSRGTEAFIIHKRNHEFGEANFRVLEKGQFGGKFANTPPLLDYIIIKVEDGSEFSPNVATVIAEALLEEVTRGSKFSFRNIHKNSHNQFIYAAAVDHEFREKLLIDAYENIDQTTSEYNELNEGGLEDNPIEKTMALNTILFGPPGTGKTFKLQNDLFQLYTEKQSTKTREQVILELVADLSWWEVIAAAIRVMGPSIVPAIAQHEFVKAKSSLSSGKTPKATIWNQLQHHTVRECENVGLANRTEPLIFSKDENSVWSLVDTTLQQTPQVEEFVLSATKPRSIGTVEKNYVMTTFHQNFTYEDFIEGIKPRISDDDEIQLSYIIQKGLFFQACEKAVQLAGYASISECIADNPSSRKEKLSKAKPYAFFIDEINRANVSSVFGELITLIEDDKRLGAEHEITDIKLPYSKSGFGVPLNLHIIGTMNTADRSVEALDTALRRRFSFVEMDPMYDLEALNVEIGGVKLGDLLMTINRRIEKLLDKDHLIGHSYLLHVKTISDLQLVFRNKILPLLQEYFFGDFGKIGLVLGEKFFESGYDVQDDNIFATFGNYDYSDYNSRVVHRLTDPGAMTTEEFEEALQVLMRR